MKLIGNFLSPYTRRVAISLHALEMPFEHELIMVSKNPERVRAYNPLVRIPALVLDDGESLVESAAILDALDDLAGDDLADEKRLVPATGKARRRVLKVTSIAVGTMDKAVWAFYETRFHPPEKVHEPWIAHNDAQVLGGIAFLEEEAKTAGKGWLVGMDRMTQADISTAVCFSFVMTVRPKLEIYKQAPALAAFAARLEALEIFKKAPIPTD